MNGSSRSAIAVVVLLGEFVMRLVAYWASSMRSRSNRVYVASVFKVTGMRTQASATGAHTWRSEMSYYDDVYLRTRLLL